MSVVVVASVMDVVAIVVRFVVLMAIAVVAVMVVVLAIMIGVGIAVVYPLLGCVPEFQNARKIGRVQQPLVA